MEFYGILGAIQKLRNGQKGEEVDDFVTYRYVYFEEERGILLVISNLLISCLHYQHDLGKEGVIKNKKPVV